MPHGELTPLVVCQNLQRMPDSTRMKYFQIVLIILLGFATALPAQQKEWPEVEKFATDIKDVIWDLRGTNSLKHLRFDGEDFHAVTSSGQSRSKYPEHAFVDDGVFQLVFSNDRAAWYFVSDDRNLITATNVSGIAVFEADKNTPAKPVKNFPQDIQNVVWVGHNGPIQLKLRWNGIHFEVGAKQGDSWHLEKADAVVANRRVLEIRGEGGAVVWIAFSADGSEAWWMTIRDVFGGHAQSNPSAAATAASTSGLSPQQNDLANHAEDLLKAGDTMRAATILRELERKNTTNKAALNHLKARFAMLKR